MSRFRVPEPGELKKRVTFCARQPGRDAAGGVAYSWSDAFSAWAKLDPLSGRELLAAQAVHAEITTEIWVRYRPALSDPQAAAALRIRYQGRYYNILSVIDVEERHQWVVCQCSAGVTEMEP